MNHLPFSLLLDIAQNQSPETQAAREGHLETCEVCQHELTLAYQLLHSARQRPMVAPPTGLIRRALTAFRRKQQESSQRVQIASTLQFDNLSQVAALGARGIKKERQLLYTFDEYDLDLQAEVEDKTLVLRGQLLTHAPQQADLEGITIRLLSGSAGPWLRLTDELGCFRISDLNAGVYSLHVLLEDRKIVVGPVVLPG